MRRRGAAAQRDGYRLTWSGNCPLPSAYRKWWNKLCCHCVARCVPDERWARARIHPPVLLRCDAARALMGGRRQAGMPPVRFDEWLDNPSFLILSPSYRLPRFFSCYVIEITVDIENCFALFSVRPDKVRAFVPKENWHFLSRGVLCIINLSEPRNNTYNFPPFWLIRIALPSLNDLPKTGPWLEYSFAES